MTSARFWNHPLLPIGIVLLVLGIGNCAISRAKVAEYSQRLRVTQNVASTDLSQFPNLDGRTNASLLRRLHRAPATASMASAKYDFYVLVDNGGRLLALLGLVLAGIGGFRLAGDRPSHPAAG